MQTTSDLKAAFYDAQRQASNLFEAVIQEFLASDNKVKELEADKQEEKKPAE